MPAPVTNPAVGRGIALFELKRFDAALREFREALSQDPADHRALTMIALCESNLHRPKSARENAEQAIRLSPTFAGAYYALAWAFFADRNFTCRRKGDIPAAKFVDSAIRFRLKLAACAIDEALRLHPRNLHYLIAKADIALTDMRPRDALAATELALAIDPTSDDALRIRAHVHRLFGNVDEARTAADSALASAPENAFNHDSAGWTALAAGSFTAARRHFVEALRLNPLQQSAKHGLAVTLRARFFFYRPIAWAIYAGGAKAKKWLHHRPLRILLIFATLTLTIFHENLPTPVVPFFKSLLTGAGAIALIGCSLHVLANYCLEFDDTARDIVRQENRLLAHFLPIAVCFIILFMVYILLGSQNQEPSLGITLLLALASAVLVALSPILARRLSRRRTAALSRPDDMR